MSNTLANCARWAALLLAAGAAMAQAPFPGRTVTMVVGFAPGGGTDTASRIIAKKLAENLGQSVVVENKPGAGGNIATELVARSAPDGITYGSSGIGGAGHLAGELFRMVAKIDIVHVPYKGGGPAVTDLLGGQIGAVFATPASAGVHVKAGKIRALAMTGPARSPSMPEVPTIAESGYPGYEATNWYAYVAPAKTPKDVLARWNQALVKVLNAPEVREQLFHHGFEPMPGTPEALTKYMEREYATWGRVVKEAKITAN